VLALGLALGVALAWRPASDHLRAASLLLRFEGAEEGLAGWVADLGVRGVVERRETVPSDHGPLRARRYLPDGAPPVGQVLLVHGVHFRGMEEPRLVRLARALAASGMEVLTPHVDSLASFRIEPEAIDQIAAASRWLAEGAPGDARVGVFGISFAGGLALMAAADPHHGHRIGWVLSLGGHHDLARVARWYGGDEASGPDGETPAVSPHPYGAGVLIRNAVERFFPAEDLPQAERAMELILREKASEARAMLGGMTPRGQAQLRRVLSREPHPELHGPLQDLIRDDMAALREVSPRGRLAGLEVPVLLLHGSDDPVVPSVETRWLEREVPPAALCQTLVTSLLRHAETRKEPTWRDQVRMVRFLAAMFAVAR
jgi:dienelactone hydrolase